MEMKKVLKYAMEIGEWMLKSGAGVSRVEDTISRICKAYGAKEANVFSITSSIVTTIEDEEGEIITQTKRIRYYKTDFKNLSVLPANMNLAGAELELAEEENRFKALKKALAPLVMEYDYIIIDCPPSLGLLSLNALTASDTLIVPLQCEYYALEGLSQLLGTVRTVKQHYNEHLELEGVLFTMYDTRLKLNSQVIEEVNQYFPNKAYKTTIPRSVKLAEAPSFGKPIFYYEKYSKPAFAYKKFADEFLKKQ